MQFHKNEKEPSMVKFPIFQEDGSISKPIQHMKDGLTWEISYIPTFSVKGTLPALDLRIECVDLGRRRCCFVSASVEKLRNSYRINSSFHVNRSVMMCRQFLVARTKTNQGIYMFCEQDILRPTNELPDASQHSVETILQIEQDGTWDIKAVGRFMADDDFRNRRMSSFVLRFDFFLSFTVPKFPPGISKTQWFNPTFQTSWRPNLPLELHLEWFERIRPNMKELLEEVPKMSEREYQDLLSVLGYYYHDYGNAKLTDGRILRIESVAQNLGFPKIHEERGFKEIAELSIMEIVEDSFPGCSVPGHSFSHISFDNEEPPAFLKKTFSIIVPIHKNTHWKFPIEVEGIHMNFSFYFSQFNAQNYISVGAVLNLPSDSAYYCHIKLSCDSISGEVERYLNDYQNTIAIPTLCKYSDHLDGCVHFKIQVELEKVPFLKPIVSGVMPGFNDVTLRIGEVEVIQINRDYLLEHFAYFKSQISFEKLESDVIEMKCFDYKSLCLVLDVLYHKTKFFKESEFKRCAMTADILACDEVVRRCEKAVENSHIDGIGDVRSNLQN